MKQLSFRLERKFSLIILFFGVADDVDDDGAGRVDDCSVVYYPPFQPKGKGVLLCCLVLIVAAVVAYSSDGPSPSDE